MAQQQNQQDQQDDGVFRFEVVVAGEYRPFEFDMDVQRFTGAEALLVDRYAGDVQQWIGRMTDMCPTGADITLVAFLAARRQQIAETGSASLDWGEFAETVAPFTLRIPGEAQAPVANRSERRRASRSGSPARRAAAAS